MGTEERTADVRECRMIPVSTQKIERPVSKARIAEALPCLDPNESIPRISFAEFAVYFAEKRTLKS
jgi:hypothetical protein